MPNGTDGHTDHVHGGRTYAPCTWLTRTPDSYEAILRNGNFNAKSKAKAEFIFHGAQNAVIFQLKWKIVAFVSFEFLSNCLMPFSRSELCTVVQNSHESKCKYWVTRSSICLHRSLICLLRTACCARALHCTYLFIHSLSHS